MDESPQEKDLEKTHDTHINEKGDKEQTLPPFLFLYPINQSAIPSKHTSKVNDV